MKEFLYSRSLCNSNGKPFTLKKLCKKQGGGKALLSVGRKWIRMSCVCGRLEGGGSGDKAHRMQQSVLALLLLLLVVALGLRIGCKMHTLTILLETQILQLNLRKRRPG